MRCLFYTQQHVMHKTFTNKNKPVVIEIAMHAVEAAYSLQIKRRAGGGASTLLQNSC